MVRGDRRGFGRSGVGISPVRATESVTCDPVSADPARSGGPVSTSRACPRNPISDAADCATADAVSTHSAHSGCPRGSIACRYRYARDSGLLHLR